MTPRSNLSSLAAVVATTLASCSTHHSSATTDGQMTVNSDQPTVLVLRAPEPTALTIEVWNDGPTDARFEQLLPDSDEMAKGMLPADGKPFRWEATTKHLEMTITTTERAVIHYRVESERGLTVSMGGK